MLDIPVKRLHRDAQLPERATALAAGWDLRACAPATLLPGVPVAVPTGLALALPPGHEMQIRPRSGLALRHAITVANAPGTIDPDYRGEIRVLMINLGASTFEVRAGTRIAQAIVARFEAPTFEWAETLDSTERGEGGFGHTGMS